MAPGCVVGKPFVPIMLTKVKFADSGGIGVTCKALHPESVLHALNQCGGAFPLNNKYKNGFFYCIRAAVVVLSIWLGVDAL